MGKVKISERNSGRGMAVINNLKTLSLEKKNISKGKVFIFTVVDWSF